MLTLTGIFVASAAFAAGIFILSKKRNNKYSTLPPGPWGLPIVGHIPFLGINPPATFLRWTKIYGPVFTVRFGSVPTVILNDVKSVKEAFSMYEFSGRPVLPIFTAMSNRRGFSYADGPHQAEQRRYTIKTLKEYGVGVSSIEARMQGENAAFIESVKSRIAQLSGKPMEINKMFRYAVINSFWDAVIGSRFEENDPTLLHLVGLLHKAFESNFVSMLFWFFPWISKLGLSVGFAPPVKAFKDFYNFIAEEIEKARSGFVEGQSSNFTHSYFNKTAQTTDPNSSFHASHKHQAISTGDMAMAAIHTTITTLDWTLIYVSGDSEIQKKIHAEIDSVIGLDKTKVPCLEDLKHMPYTEAVTTEVLRISGIAPFALHHRTMEDVTFRGYKYPKDTMVISNLYALHNDPNVWENPDEFNPGRFLDDQGQLKKAATEFMAPFGLGKRSCAGERFARDQLFLLTTNFFREFRISQSENVPSLVPDFGIVFSPQPFELFVHERS